MESGRRRGGRVHPGTQDIHGLLVVEVGISFLVKFLKVFKVSLSG